MERVEVLRDILLEAGELESFFGGVVPVDLWRAKKTKDTGALFGLVEAEVVRPRGAPRKPDITIENGWVRVRLRPRGISTFDRPDIFKGSWNYYKIPADTLLPAGLVVVRDRFNQNFGATHYTIAPAHDMTLVSFRALLRELATLLEQDSAYGNH